MKQIYLPWLYTVASVYLFLGIVVGVALTTYCPTDPSWLVVTVPFPHAHNFFGVWGAQCAATLVWLFGAAAWLIPFFAAALGCSIFITRSFYLDTERMAAALIFFLSRIIFLGAQPGYVLRGGIIGKGLALLLIKWFDQASVSLFAWYFMLAAFIVWWQFAGVAWGCYKLSWIYQIFKIASGRVISKISVISGRNQSPLIQMPTESHNVYQETNFGSSLIAPEAFGMSDGQVNKSSDSEVSSKLVYQIPALSLFKVVHRPDAAFEKRCADQKEHARLVEQKLLQFGIRGSVVHATVGPLLTLFEYAPDSDIKLSRITAFEDDLALALQAVSVRIIAPLPGKAVVGIEVAYQETGEVSFASLINSSAFQKRSAQLPLILGKDVVGNPTFIDLVTAPHLLVAGTTGSGKSVGLHSMIASLLATKTPDELRLVLVDPKQLEFACYEQIPHLCAPVITNPGAVVPVFEWLVATMQERYQLMAKARVRTIAEYNLQNPNEPFAYLVVVIDELADLMVTAGRQIEEYLLRIAQMARAAGIHMIVATQRPSVDVLTGLIKVNFPTRIAFRVASKIDSRTIIDAVGAERLLGKGDMLFLSTTGSLMRVHGAYISKSDLSALVEHIQQQSPPLYLFSAQAYESHFSELSNDPLYQDVVQFLNDVDEISISLIQRRFKIGYNRSARLVEQLQQEKRIIDVPSSKMKKVLK